MKLKTLAAGILIASLATSANAATYKRGLLHPSLIAGQSGQPIALRGASSITQSTSLTPVADASPYCADEKTGVHTDNSFYRRFDLATFGASGAGSVTSVDIAIQIAEAGAGTSQPLEIRLYSIPAAAPLALANLIEIGSATVSVNDQTLAALNVPVAGAIPDAATHHLVVEIFTPDGQAAGNVLAAGFNDAGQTAPSYTFAAGCGDADITDLADIGFGDAHLVMSVTGTGLPVSLQEFRID